MSLSLHTRCHLWRWLPFCHCKEKVTCITSYPFLKGVQSRKHILNPGCSKIHVFATMSSQSSNKPSKITIDLCICIIIAAYFIQYLSAGKQDSPIPEFLKPFSHNRKELFQQWPEPINSQWRASILIRTQGSNWASVSAAIVCLWVALKEMSMETQYHPETAQCIISRAKQTIANAILSTSSASQSHLHILRGFMSIYHFTAFHSLYI